jgi:hypothetical protein
MIKIVTILLIILLIFHFRKYKQHSESYEIEQQELEYIHGDELYNQLNPIIITFIEDDTFKFNIDTYKLFSQLSVNRDYMNIIPSDKYYRHSSELVLIRPSKDIKIELTNPKYFEFFKYSSKNININEYTLDKKNYSDVANIEIILHAYNILYIPRFWLFTIFNNDINTKVEIFSCHNIFTYLFNIFN